MRLSPGIYNHFYYRNKPETRNLSFFHLQRANAVDEDDWSDWRWISRLRKDDDLCRCSNRFHEDRTTASLILGVANCLNPNTVCPDGEMEVVSFGGFAAFEVPNAAIAEEICLLSVCQVSNAT